MRLYIAGPMTGHAQFNIPAFDAAAEVLRAEGHEVVSPAELDDPATREAALASPDGAPGSGSSNGETWGDFLARDLKLIADDGIEGIVALPGWETSRGARTEVFNGLNLDLPIWEFSFIHPGYLRPLAPGDVVDGLFPRGVDPEYQGFPVVPDESVPEGEVRIVDAKTGGAKGQKLAQLGAVDPLALLAVAEVAGFGASKYDRMNFVRGYAWSLSYDAMQRHLHLFWSGQETDDESGLSHLAHAAWHALALITFGERGLGTDDRIMSFVQGASEGS